MLKKTQAVVKWLSNLNLPIYRKNPSIDEMKRALQYVVDKTDNTCLITFGGTNGKGSTIALIDNFLIKEGFNVGKLTSPHLVNFNERIVIDGKPVEDDLIISSFEKIKKIKDKYNISLTYFEFVTLGAFNIFNSAKLDFWLLEIGIGGRYDAVNTLSSDLAILTNIELDHTEILGDTREKIGSEKIHIAREAVPIVINDSKIPKNVLLMAKAIGANTYSLKKQYEYKVYDSHLEYDKKWSFEFPSLNIFLDELPYPSSIHIQNAVGALALLSLISKYGFVGNKKDKKINAKVKLSRTNFINSLDSLDIRGRFQQVEYRLKYEDSLYDRDSCAFNLPIVLDVAHNLNGVNYLADRLIEHLDSLAEDTDSELLLHIAFSAMRDKNIEEMLKILIYKISKYLNNKTKWYLIDLGYERSCDVCYLSKVVTNQINSIDPNMTSDISCFVSKKSDFINYSQEDILEVIDGVMQNIDREISLSKSRGNLKKDKHLLIAFGSFYLVGSFLSFINENS